VSTRILDLKPDAGINSNATATLLENIDIRRAQDLLLLYIYLTDKH